MDHIVYQDLVFDECVILSADGVALSNLETVEERSEPSDDEVHIDAEEVRYAARSPAGRHLQKHKLELRAHNDLNNLGLETSNTPEHQDGSDAKIQSEADHEIEDLIKIATSQEQHSTNMSLQNGNVCNSCKGLYGNQGCELCCETTTFCEEPVVADYKWGDGDGEIEIPGYTKEDLDNVKKHWEEKFAAEKQENLFPKPASNKPIKMVPDAPDNRDINENIDTESIADLSTRKQQWEKLLFDKQEETLKRKPKKSSMVRSATFDQPIKLSTAETLNAPPQKEIMVDKPIVLIDQDSNIDSESAIDREIRYNLERERAVQQEHLKRPLAERLDSNDSSTEAEGQLQSSFASSSFHEMTEADRGTKVDYNNIIEKEVQAQQKRETQYRRESVTKPKQYDKKAKQEYEQSEYERQEKEHERAAHESIIEREIRLQRQREEEIQRERKRLSGGQTRQQPVSPRQQVPIKSEPKLVETESDPKIEIITAESQTPVNTAAPGPPSQEPEINMSKFPEVQSFEQRQSQNNVVIREIEEQEKRERELRDQRKSLGYKFDEQDTNKPVFDSFIDKSESNSSYNREVSPFKPGVPNHAPAPAVRRASLDSVSSSRSTASSHTQSDTTTPRQRHMVEPLNVEEEEEEEESLDRPDEHSEETIVERTIRLQREREDDFRRSRGLTVEEPKPVKSAIKVDISSKQKQRQNADRGKKSEALKKLSTSQLQREIALERKRELDLKAEGTIRTTSDEHMAVPASFRGERKMSNSKSAPQIAPTKEVASTEPDAPSVNDTGDEVDGGVVMRKVSKAGGMERKMSNNPAGSRIEQELREMREREDELRRQQNRKTWAPGDRPPVRLTQNTANHQI